MRLIDTVDGEREKTIDSSKIWNFQNQNIAHQFFVVSIVGYDSLVLVTILYLPSLEETLHRLWKYRLFITHRYQHILIVDHCGQPRFKVWRHKNNKTRLKVEVTSTCTRSNFVTLFFWTPPHHALVRAALPSIGGLCPTASHFYYFVSSWRGDHSIFILNNIFSFPIDT